MLTTRARSRHGPRRRSPPSSASWAVTARAGTSWCGTSTCPRTCGRATWWPCPARAPTASRCRRTTTSPRGPACSPCPPAARTGSSDPKPTTVCWDATAARSSMPERTSMDKLTVALLGGGVVGAEVARTLLTRADALAARVGARLELTGVLVRDTAKERDGIPAELLTTDAEAVVAGADIVVELMGGIEPARTHILDALSSGASVVTANKALLAQHFPELITAADDAGVRIEYEAAVAGAIPIVRPLSVSLAGDRVERVMGIVNGTTNYILDQMSKEGWDFGTALATAQELGYAEADPTADIEGLDAAAKAAIIASLAFQVPVAMDDVHVEGIASVSADMIETAAAQGFTIKLLAICERIDGADGAESVSARVYPALIRDDHPLASVSGAFNAVFVEAENAGSLMFYGQGAGGAPTSSAIMGDLVSVARRRVLGGRGQVAQQVREVGD